jgi:hypothetical protein
VPPPSSRPAASVRTDRQSGQRRRSSSTPYASSSKALRHRPAWRQPLWQPSRALVYCVAGCLTVRAGLLPTRPRLAGIHRESLGVARFVPLLLPSEQLLLLRDDPGCEIGRREVIVVDILADQIA